MGREGDAVKLDPADITDGESAQVTENIFDTLVTYRNSSTQIKPDLALSWSSSKNGKIWIFHLRHHVRFQDGTKFNAASVVFNFDQ
ncbi:MAG: ABC transporter substrate-binding protein [Candidatus Eremiobacteraeota bacterium]|nr:ABC transporter substrate-binding protein [Candidatus Eremiobacteraeota bacterium]